MSEPHEHDWQPCRGWMGRYRCSICLALGYRKLVLPHAGTNWRHTGKKQKVAQIVIYICKHKDCKRPAITHRHEQKCTMHKTKDFAYEL